MEYFEKKISAAGIANGFTLRPRATSGLWLCPLLPLAVILSTIKHPSEASHTYHMAAVLCIGLLLAPVVFVMRCVRGKDVNKSYSLYIVSTLVASPFFFLYRRGFMFSLLSGLLSAPVYYKFFLFVIQRFSSCFTFGEATIVTQSFILFIYTTLLNIYRATQAPPNSMFDVGTLIVQMGLLSIGVICLLSYNMKLFRRPAPFYWMVLVIFITGVMMPVQILARTNAIGFLYRLIFRNAQTCKVMFYWFICSVCAVVTLNRQISGAKKASTIVRKTFHILAVAVYLPGLLYDCSLLYIASAIIFGIFISLELVRQLALPPWGKSLQEGFLVFCDEKDSTVALTPLYLLAGCSLPLWIHPAPCDITDSVGFYLLPMVSGLLSVGVGDTAASIFGSMFGRHHWPNSKKTVEGTIACVLFQVLFVAALFYLDLLRRGHLQLVKSGIGIIVTSLIEAKTSQVDNLVLPLLMYLIFI